MGLGEWGEFWGDGRGLMTFEVMMMGGEVMMGEG